MTIAEKFGVDPAWAVERRIDYLTNQCADYKTRLDMAALEWDSDVAHNTPLMERMFKWYMADVPALRKKLKRYTTELIMRLRGQEYGDISLELVELARGAEIADFCEVDRQYKTICPWHEDKRPSCYVRNGWAYCFSCGKSGDILDFVMAKYGLKFPEAIKFITGVGE